MQLSNTSELPEALYTAAECRDIDRRVIEGGTVSGYELMTQAGQFAFDVLTEKFPDTKSLIIICGRGNNGGDGYVLAGLAKHAGLAVKVFALGGPTTDDAASAMEFAQQQECNIINCSGGSDLTEEFRSTDILIDALLGTGVDRPVTGYLADLVNSINNSKVPVLSCDVPTGLNSDTGSVMGCCVKANITTTFIALKAGMFTADGKEFCGLVKFSDLQADSSAYLQSKPVAKLISSSSLEKIIRPRLESAHKGTTGYAAIIGGSPGMVGAVLMAGKAAYRIGAGRVKVLTHLEHSSALALSCPELLTHGMEKNDTEVQYNQFQAIAIGPGLGQDEWARKLFNQVIQSKLPLVVDADALNLLALEKIKRENWILTPHPGEAARLLNCSVRDVQNNRFEAVNLIVEQYGGVCVLKGSGSLIASQGRVTRVCNSGNSGQATAGMGDVLTGCIVGLVVQGYSLFDAACLGTWLHATAADVLANENGKIGMLATDLFPQLQKLHNHLAC